MKKIPKPTLTELAMQALAEAVAKVVEDHHKRNLPLGVWRDGKAVSIPAKEAKAQQENPRSYGRMD